MKKIIYLFLFINSLLFAQKETYHWFMGRGVHVDFNTEPPTIHRGDNNVTKWGAGASWSDSTGKLLFYTDGKKIWNAKGELFINGTDLGGWSGGWQNKTILPFPHSNLYLLVNNDSNAFDDDLPIKVFRSTLNLKLSYCIVKYDEESMQGEVILKNQVLWQPALFDYDIVQHADKESYWVVSADITSGLSKMIAFHINSCGVQDTVFSDNGIFPIEIDTLLLRADDNELHNLYSFNPFHQYFYYLDFSPNQSQVYFRGTLFSFDNQTGKLGKLPYKNDTLCLSPYREGSTTWLNDSKTMIHNFSRPKSDAVFISLGLEKIVLNDNNTKKKFVILYN